MKENDYIVRQWPSGRLSMGQAVSSKSGSSPDKLLFKALETYSLEGGVISGDIYGYVAPGRIPYKHRVATDIEVEVFKRYNTLKDIEQNYRELKLETLGV